MQVKNNSFLLVVFLLLFTIALLLCTRYTGICYQHSTWKFNHPFSYTLILSYFSVNIFYSKPDFLHSKQKKYKHLSKLLTCYWYATSLEFSANFASRLWAYQEDNKLQTRWWLLLFRTESDSGSVSGVCSINSPIWLLHRKSITFAFNWKYMKLTASLWISPHFKVKCHNIILNSGSMWPRTMYSIN